MKLTTTDQQLSIPTSQTTSIHQILQYLFLFERHVICYIKML